jgi:hypothetical protein
MLLQILADARQVLDHVDADRAEVVGGADPRQHQQLRGAVGARRQDDFPVGADLLELALSHIFDADRPAALDQDAHRLGMGEDGEVGPRLHRRMQIGASRAGAPASVGGDLHPADAFLLGTVVIEADRQARIGGGAHQMGEEGLGNVDGDIADRPLVAVIEAGSPPAALQLLEIGKDVAIGPAFQSLLAPHVEIVPAAAHVDHGVDRGAAAQRAAPPDRQRAAAESRFRLGLIGPDERLVGRDLGKGDRHRHERMIVPPPGLEHQDGNVALFTEARGDDRSGRTRTHHDIIESLHRRGSPMVESAIDTPPGARATAVTFLLTQSPPSGRPRLIPARIGLCSAGSCV